MPASHEENCTKECLICFKKQKTCRPITGVALERVQKYFLASYNPSAGIYSAGICSNHRNFLNAIQQGTADLSDLPKTFQSFYIPQRPGRSLTFVRFAN